MANLNKVLLMGNLTRDPEMRVTPGGMAICKFSLAVNRTWRDKDGNQQTEATFIDVDSFGRQAETISKYMTKGRGIFVEGRLRLDQWESQAGEKRSRMVVVLENFQFVGGRSDEQGGGHEGGEGHQGGGEPTQSASPPDQHAPPPRAARPTVSRPSPAPRQQDNDEDVPF